MTATEHGVDRELELDLYRRMHLIRGFEDLVQSLFLRGEVYGTPAYMAMEQAFGDVDSIDERTDVFGLGGILYEILTQKPPHTSTQSIIRGIVPDPREVVPGRALPARLCEIANKCLQGDQNDRYPNVAAKAASVCSCRRAAASRPGNRPRYG